MPFAQTTPATIDESKRGSLTIHKYEYNGDEVIPGTGEEGNQIPSDAKALAGAGFTIYKVVDLDGMTAYYNKDPENLPSVDTYVDSETGVIKEEYADKKVGDQIVPLHEFNGISAAERLKSPRAGVGKAHCDILFLTVGLHDFQVRAMDIDEIVVTAVCAAPVHRNFSAASRKMKKIGIGRKSSALFRRKITVLIDYIFAVLCEHSQSVKKHHPQIIEGQVAASFKKTADLIADYTSALYYASLGEECVFIF